MGKREIPKDFKTGDVNKFLRPTVLYGIETLVSSEKNVKTDKILREKRGRQERPKMK